MRLRVSWGLGLWVKGWPTAAGPPMTMFFMMKDSDQWRKPPRGHIKVAQEVGSVGDISFVFGRSLVAHRASSCPFCSVHLQTLHRYLLSCRANRECCATSFHTITPSHHPTIPPLNDFIANKPNFKPEKPKCHSCYSAILYDLK